MYKLCKTEQSADRQRWLEQGLLDAMKTQRYEDITVSGLCVQLGIPRKAFYRYFDSKDGALHALLDHTLLDFERETGILSGSGLSEFARNLRNFFEFWYDRRALLDALEKSGISGVLVERAVSQAQQEYMAAQYLLTEELRSAQHYGIAFGICGVMSMMTAWHHDGYRQSVEEMAALTAKLLTKPLLKMPE